MSKSGVGRMGSPYKTRPSGVVKRIKRVQTGFIVMDGGCCSEGVWVMQIWRGRVGGVGWEGGDLGGGGGDRSDGDRVGVSEDRD